MTTNDDRWAPPGASEPTAPSPSAWAPAGQVPPTTPPTAPVSGPPIAEPTPMPVPDGADVDRVDVAPVEATPTRGAGAAARIAAAGVAAVMIGGGAFLALNAASAETGAESPEAAMEAAMAAVEAEDLVALAEIMEPSERETIFEAGFDFVDELVRLEVIDPGVDLSSIDGIDLEFDGFETRVERPGNGLAHIYLGEGVVTGSIDMAELPLGPLLLERMTDDQLSFAETDSEPAGPTTTPMVAVERDGRWYLSYWYTFAENVRIELDAGLPDLSRRPATIGGATPDAALRQMLDDVVNLDMRRMIGSLDPEEMAVLYDYAPLFLDDVDELANEALSAARDAGWSWELLDLTTRTETDGDLAEVFVEGVHFRADSEDGGLIDIRIGEDTFQLDVRLVDEFFGDEMSMSMEITDEGCVAMTVDEGSGPESETICGDELGEQLGFGGLAAPSGVTGADQLDTVGIVTRQVDGVWYVSPMRTGLNAIIAAIEQVEPDTLAELADFAIDLGLNGTDIMVPDLGEPLIVPDTVDPAPDLFDPTAGLVNVDLLADGLDPNFAWDLTAEDTASEVDFWARGLGTQEFERGVYATVTTASGDVAIVAAEVADPAIANDALGAFAVEQGAEMQKDGVGVLVETVDVFGDPLLVYLQDSRLTVVGVYGADLADASRVLELQLAGS